MQFPAQKSSKREKFLFISYVSKWGEGCGYGLVGDSYLTCFYVTKFGCMQQPKRARILDSFQEKSLDNYLDLSAKMAKYHYLEKYVVFYHYLRNI